MTTTRDIVMTAVVGLCATVAVLGLSWIVAGCNADQRANGLQRMQTCVQAGGTWVYSSCITPGTTDP